MACVLGVSTTLLGILLAYDSSYWDSSSQGLPVSFFIVAITFTGYLCSGIPAVRRISGTPRAATDDVAGRRSRDRWPRCTH